MTFTSLPARVRVLMFFLISVVAASLHAAMPLELDGVPLHPRAMQKFDGWLSDNGPHVLALDLQRGRTGNELSDAMKIREGGWIESAGEDGTSYGYRVLGLLRNGLIVVQTSDAGGGSGVFYEVKVLRREQRPFMQANKREERQVIRLVGVVVLGDRFDGSVRLHENTVWVERSSATEGSPERRGVAHVFADDL